MDFEQAVSAGWDAADPKDAELTLRYFADLLDRYPDDPRAIFEVAHAFDWSGQHDEAVPIYEQSFAAGLAGDDLRRAMAQSGSALRNLGRADEAVALLERANVLFPGSDIVRSFLALALQSAGRSDEAIAELLDLALDRVQSEDFERYEWAIRKYAAALRPGISSSATDDDGRTPTD